jgi:drug/metabolite transporter (DMT)-like permease
MLPSSLIGILSGLTSAFVWGSGDFAGGLASRRITQFQVVTISALVGVIILSLVAFLRREPFPSSGSIVWSLAAGLSGVIGVAALYQGLSTGSAAVIAPTSGVVAAIIPVIASVFLEGLPSATQVLGISLGLAGIYLVSRPLPGASSPREMDATSSEAARGSSEFTLALLAGAGFGGFFVMIAQVEPDLLYGPLAFAKLSAFVLGCLILLIRERSLRGLSVRTMALNPLAVLAGVLDAGGNLFFLIAVRYVPLAVAGVLASMYPAATVILAMAVLHQRIVRFQAIGVLLCLAAVAMVTLE